MRPNTHTLVAVVALSVLAAPSAARGQDARPLPDQQAFLAETVKRLRSNDLLRSQYVFRQTDTRVSRDSDRRAKKTDVKVYEVFPAPEPSLTDQRLILVSGDRYQTMLDLLDRPAQDNPCLRDLFSRPEPWETP